MLIKEPELRWPIVVLAAIITAVIAVAVATMHYLVMNQQSIGPDTVPRATWAFQAGHPDAERLGKDIAVDQLVGREKVHPFNNLAVELTAVVTNRTNRVVSGLEMRGAIVDRENAIVRERTVAIVPAQQRLLEVDESVSVRILLEGVGKDSDRAQTLLEVTGIQFQD
jgi:hypothetical protein